MRHKVLGKSLNRSPSHRKAMERNFVCAVIKHERIVTTLSKAKALRRNVEKMITLGKTKDLTRLRRAVSYLNDEDAAHKLFDELGPRYANRPGGYTRIVRLSGARVGDGATRAILELVDNKVLEQQLSAAAVTEDESDEGEE